MGWPGGCSGYRYCRHRWRNGLWGRWGSVGDAQAMMLSPVRITTRGAIDGPGQKQQASVCGGCGDAAFIEPQIGENPPLATNSTGIRLPPNVLVADCLGVHDPLYVCVRTTSTARSDELGSQRRHDLFPILGPLELALPLTLPTPCDRASARQSCQVPAAHIFRA
jgi:hypothetical protein